MASIEIKANSPYGGVAISDVAGYAGRLWAFVANVNRRSDIILRRSPAASQIPNPYLL
ncbi:MAG: hypothetical protein AAGJ09_02935 [Pseudomonadota bacterium]